MRVFHGFLRLLASFFVADVCELLPTSPPRRPTAQFEAKLARVFSYSRPGLSGNGGSDGGGTNQRAGIFLAAKTKIEL